MRVERVEHVVVGPENGGAAHAAHPLLLLRRDGYLVPAEQGGHLAAGELHLAYPVVLR